VAKKIPWLGNAFRGFIIGLWHRGHLHRFSTYLGFRLRYLAITDETVDLVVESRRERLQVRAIRSEEGLLRAPYQVKMERRSARA
jgi:hypothetical protein